MRRVSRYLLWLNGAILCIFDKWKTIKTMFVAFVWAQVTLSWFFGEPQRIRIRDNIAEDVVFHCISFWFGKNRSSSQRSQRLLWNAQISRCTTVNHNQLCSHSEAFWISSDLFSVVRPCPLQFVEYRSASLLQSSLSGAVLPSVLWRER